MTRYEETPFEMRRFGGKFAGPNLLVTAGVHGDEFLPMLAVRALIARLESDPDSSNRLRGTLTLIPVVNRSAFRRGHRCGADDKDLARTCPGRKDGSVTEQVAYALSQQISKADFYVDLHTGGTELCVQPLAGYVLHADHAILDQQRRLARAFQLPLLWGTSARLHGRSLSVARDAGVPAIYIEYLGAHRELAEIACGGVTSSAADHPLVAGCLNLMRHLQMLDQPERSDAVQTVIEDWRENSGHMQASNPAPATGFLTIRAKLGQRVNRGDLLAEIATEGGDSKHCVVSEQAGTVVVLREYPRINEGDAVVVIAESSERP